LRRNTGLVLLFRTETFGGRHCRDCGIAKFRDTTNYTLIAGWWGLISFFVNWVFLIANVVSRRKVNALTRPVRVPGSPPPLDAGRALWKRAGIWVPIGAIVLASVSSMLGDGSETSGFYNIDRPEDLLERCVEIVGDEVGEADCGSANDGRISGVVDSEADCPATSDGSFRLQGGRIGSKIVCVSSSGP
jgi:hypothetical protein